MCTVIGVKEVDYKKENGHRVYGLEVVYTFESKRYAGVNADRAWIPGTVIEEKYGEAPAPGDKIEFTYGRSRDGKAFVNGWNKVG